ncbi:Transcriptional regulator [Seminavis robusta]|uniref:Transcriptional regulator n=1 Tax=Seminavis robusta TaxID=568900 RepID=A0A9N8EAX2_9STRA|nr:Transcriptional regulator [Seminavis robusta]|eukprot:Sro878_g214810.1 Transcriptional regulator (1102) ;mRNA; r:38372-41677
MSGSGNKRQLTGSIRNIYGRDQEIQILSQGLDQIGTTVPLIFVGGKSGTGKSALIEHVLKSSKGQAWLIGTCKFEQAPNPNPHGVLLTALGKIIRDILQLHPGSRGLYRKKLVDAFQAGELSHLTELLPELGELLETKNKKTSIKSLLKQGGRAFSIRKLKQNSYHSRGDLERFKFSMRLLLRTLASVDKTVILSCDDLHWIDKTSLDVLQAILLDNELRNLAFIGSFRDDEVDGTENTHGLSNFLEAVKSSSRAAGCRHISVNSLPVTDVQSLLEAVLKTADGIEALTEFVYQRTGGNVFYIKQLLDSLEARKLMQYTYSSTLSMLQWTWNIESLKSKTTVSQDVAEIIKANIDLLSDNQRLILARCACLGFRFHQRYLEIFEQNNGNEEEKQIETSIQDYTEDVNVLIEAGMLEEVDEMLKFSHDSILEAALLLIANDAERSQLHFQIGHELYNRHFAPGVDASMKEQEHTDQILFLCVDQLNSGIDAICLCDERGIQLSLAELNFQAAKKAAEFSSFDHAMVYAKNGIELLEKESCWKENYDLALGMHTIFVQMSFCTGSNDMLEQMVGVITSNSKNVVDSTKAWLVLIEYLGFGNRFEEMLQTILHVFELAGEELAPDPTMEYARTKFEQTAAKLNKLTDDDILNLPTSDDPLKEFCIRVLGSAHSPVNHLKGPRAQITYACKMVDLTLEHGLGRSSADAFSVFSSSILSEFYETRLAARAGALTLKLTEKLHLTERAASARVCAANQFTWHKPLSLSLDYLMETYQMGLRSGEVGAACLSIVAYGFSFYYCGLNLMPLAKDLGQFIVKMHYYGQTSTLLFALSNYQCVLNLTGQSDSVLDIGGGESQKWRKIANWNGKTGGQSDLSYLLQIAIFCRNKKIAVETKEKLLVSDKVNSSAVVNGAYYFGLARAFYMGIVSYWQYHTCSKLNLARRQKLLGEAKKFHDMVRSWVVEHGSINLPQKLFILEAEQLRAQGVKGADLKAAYEKAIVASTKSGFTQDAALAAHLASEAIPKERENFLQQARSSYLRWGATGVVQYIDRDLVVEDQSSGEMEESSFRARRRFSEAMLREEAAIPLQTNPEKLHIANRDNRNSIS